MITKTADLYEDIDFLKNQITNIKKESEHKTSSQKQAEALSEEEVSNRNLIEPSAPPKYEDTVPQIRSRSKAKKDL